MTYEKVLKFAEEAGFMNNSLGLTYTTGRLDECLKKFATLIEEGVLGDSKPVAWCSFDDTGHPNKFRLNSFNRASALYTHPAPDDAALLRQCLRALQDIYIAPEHLDYLADWWPACREVIIALRDRLGDKE